MLDGWARGVGGAGASLGLWRLGVMRCGLRVEADRPASVLGFTSAQEKPGVKHHLACCSN